ncbi:MAG: LUD domain-containing protein, partial [Bacteroidales bacterium]|nr:LUD domain-containing protein [Bacteroidales bacterium]
LIAQAGSVVWNNASAGRRAMAQADDVVFVASVEQVMPDFRTAVRLMKEGKEKVPSMISRWTGMPCFFDIDGASMTGCGPRNVYLILIDNL